MLSLAKPDQYYQAGIYFSLHGSATDYTQVFLSQGIGSGCAAGLLYIPSMAVVSQYFRKRRALVMTFVASGACLGAVVHPIMLNNTLNGSLGFANGVRASAGLVKRFTIHSMFPHQAEIAPIKSTNKFSCNCK